MKEGVSVCFVVRNGLINGYPFWESLNSCVKFADEIVISEGYSDDDTYKVLEVFKEKNPTKVNLFRTDWKRFVSPYGEVITHVSQEAISKCSYSWVYYLQADEIVHEGNHQFIKDVADGKFSDQGFRAVSFPFRHCIGSWNPLPENSPAYSEAIRMVVNSSSIRLMGDAWNFTGSVSPCYPAGAVPKPIYHLAWVFPKNIHHKNISQGEIYKNLPDYQRKANASREQISKGHENHDGYPHPDNGDQFPVGIDRLFGAWEYTLPDGILN